MPSKTDEVLSDFLKNIVADALLNDYTDDDFDKRKVEFLLSEYSADASEAKRIYQLDAGIDAYSVEQDEDGNAIISIWQLSGPAMEQIKAGEVAAPPNKKLEHDLGHLADALAKRQQHMSNTAAEALAFVDHAFKRAKAAGKCATIYVYALSLYRISDAMKHKAKEAAQRRLAEAVPNGLAPTIHYNVYDVTDYASADAGTSGTGPPLDDLSISLAADTSLASYGTAYLVFATPDELVNYYLQHGPALLHTNARYFLGKGKATANKAIEQSAQDSSTAKHFHELNNGLVVTCTAVEIMKASSGQPPALKLSRPQVVNGGQTLHTLSDVKRREMKGGKSAISELVVPLKIVVLEQGPSSRDALTERAARIAKASNTQAALSSRALASYAGVNAQLQRSFAKLKPRWFFEKTDGEWKAFRNATAAHRKVITGVEDVAEFQFKPSGAKKPTSRIVKNSEILEALLAAYGCFEDATKKRMFESDTHPAVLSSVLTSAEWRSFSSDKENKRTYAAFIAQYPGEPTSVPPVHFLLLVWTLFRSVRELSLSEKPAQEWAMGYWRGKKLGGPFEDYSAWLTYCSENPLAAVFEGAEDVANAMQKPIVFQMLRLLSRRYGALDEMTCAGILSLPQFADVAQGRPIERTLDAKKCRSAKIGNKASPLYTLYQLCRNACGMVYESARTQIDSMGTKQQALLTTEWVKTLSNQVDALAGNITPNKMKLLTGTDYTAAKLAKMLPDVPNSLHGRSPARTGRGGTLSDRRSATSEQSPGRPSTKKSVAAGAGRPSATPERRKPSVKGTRVTRSTNTATQPLSRRTRKTAR